MQKVLLHVCCGPCATYPIEALRETHEVTLFFSNSNIAPKEEYLQRLASGCKLAQACGMPLMEDEYDHFAWLEAVSGLESEPEGGRRCELCFTFNLSRTARYAADHGFDCFSTTLMVSPRKNSALLFKVGAGLGAFLERDWKKNGGFQRTLELSRAYGLYRQDYCGCEFSLRDRPAKAPSV